jgi:hypothetical protein
MVNLFLFLTSFDKGVGSVPPPTSTETIFAHYYTRNFEMKYTYMYLQEFCKILTTHFLLG